MKVDTGIVDGGRRVNAPDKLSGSRLEQMRDVDDSASILPTELLGSNPAEPTRKESPTLSDELVHALGLGWTRQNPVWTSEALNRMRSLQHVLMKQAFSMPVDDRSPVLEGVKAMEIAISLRVRLEVALHEQQQAILRGTANEQFNPARMSRDDSADQLVRVA